ncbi:hypothetical protein H0H81_001856 [Sphagnurus paluster]|uniref:DNA2/NAM7 helicase-like C-terminal domain-containing protein n=1 Tax=Sphagnurus paluster TaxID=117069 RepID=A0A9P7FVY1_9AGAR|nr:hypothetical protein H0H81_001856 [Sphagnurus paluster]
MVAQTTIFQKILPYYPENIQVCNYARRHAGMAARALQKCTSKFFGIAMKRSSNGRAGLLALAKIDQIVVVDVNMDDPPAGLLACDAPFEDLLSGKGGYTLVGFDMPRVVLRIAGDMNLKACGIDLSTAFVVNTRKPLRLSEVIAARLFSAVDGAIVEDLLNERGGSREVCLRAWLAVCVAQNNAQALEKVFRINTGRLNIQVVIMTNEAGDEFSGQVRRAKGRTTNIRFTGAALSGPLHRVRVIGSPQLTNPEKARDEMVLHVLQGIANIKTPFITKIWFPSKRSQDQLNKGDSDVLFPDLNKSQERVAAIMVSNAPLVVAHGPPGTGKTTTIAAAVSRWNQSKQPTWIVAHSNVAVKNIAETLYKRNVDFKIIVSKEFHFEWHEHIYTMIQQRVLRSDDFSGMKDVTGVSSLIQGSCIILSTLSMLSNPGLDEVGLFKVVPMKQLVVDEASQIKIEDFMPIFQKFGKTLRKVCFFGDPQQLPPYGKENLPEIKTIFDIQHLKGCGEFLDTQYRMPTLLGNFISKNLYGGRLMSQHSIHDASCVSFVDVPNGYEAKSGFSWTNDGEINTMVNLVKNYYKHTNFCIITPYDAQRAAIERQLKAQDLPWERIFNVDSFQGNEADFVLVSVVRSGNLPGFLSSINRMNVLLTRCKKGLVIVTSRSFLSHGGRFTLLGALESHWSMLVGERAWVDWRSVSQGIVNLPGAPGPNRPREPMIYGASSSSTSIPQRIFDVKTLFRPRVSQVQVRVASSEFANPCFSTQSLNTGIPISSVSSFPPMGSPIVAPDVGRHYTKSRDLVEFLPTPDVQNYGEYTNQVSYDEEFPPVLVPIIHALDKKPKAPSMRNSHRTAHPTSSQKHVKMTDRQKQARNNTHNAVPSLESIADQRTHTVPPDARQAPKPEVLRPTRGRRVVLRLEISASQIARTRLPKSGENATKNATKNPIKNPTNPKLKNSLCLNDNMKTVIRRMK